LKQITPQKLLSKGEMIGTAAIAAIAKSLT
jgi:hypothetical protein